MTDNKTVKKSKENGNFKPDEKKKAKEKHDEISELLEQTDAYFCLIKNKWTMSIISRTDCFELGNMLKEAFDNDYGLFKSIRASVKAYEEWIRFKEKDDSEKIDELISKLEEIRKVCGELN